MREEIIGNCRLILGDCMESLRKMPDNSVDSIVTDPPYGLAFMGKKWDYDVPSVEIWAECLRVLKPGGHLLAFAGTRTQHRMAVRIEDAGFEIRDMIAWVYGSGFPKSLDVSKALDKAAGAERESIGPNQWADRGGLVQANTYGAPSRPDATAPATDAAREWAGWGTALKPALEPITMARKPLVGTVAANVLEYGTGALNIDACRVEGAPPSVPQPSLRPNGNDSGHALGTGHGRNGVLSVATGRWPANLIHDGSDEVMGLFPVTKSGALNAGHKQGTGSFGTIGGETILRDYGGDTGSAARFFYCAKASKRDRDEGLEGAEFAARRMFASGGRTMRDGEWVETDSEPRPRKNTHPTVKPTDLMAYLCRLVTPPGGVVLDPFMGSGSTGKAAMREGFRFIGCELSPEYMTIARARIEDACRQPRLIMDEQPIQEQGAMFEGVA